MTAADLALISARCLFCPSDHLLHEQYGGKPERHVLYCAECEYRTRDFATKAECLASHNALARRAALFPEAVELLEQSEWGGIYSGDCPLCGGDKPAHEPDCELAKFLKRAAEITQGVQQQNQEQVEAGQVDRQTSRTDGSGHPAEAREVLVPGGSPGRKYAHDHRAEQRHCPGPDPLSGDARTGAQR